MTQSGPYAIFRIEKLKSRGEVSGSGQHMMRGRPTPNADPERTHLNETLRGSSDPTADVEARLADLDRNPGKNSVMTLEVLATASPEWFNQASDDDVRRWIDQTQQWLDDTFGHDNVVSLHVHRDEETPHVTGFVVPAKHDKGGALRLSAAHWVDGGKKLAQLQDGYADAIADLGIRRGVKGSKAEHTTIREYYGQITSDRKDLDDPDQAKKLAATAESDRRQKTKYQHTAEDQAKRIEELQRENETLREQANRVRDIPLIDVASELGLQRDPDDQAKWHTPEGDQAISITDQKFYDHKADKGGGGAIDLVMYVLGRVFQDAVAWLAERFGTGRTTGAIIARADDRADKTVAKARKNGTPFALPPDLPKHHGRVRQYLKNRGIESSIIDQAMQSGKIRSDARSNLVAVMHDETGRVVGAEKRGTGQKPFHGLERGSDRDGTFYLAGDGQIRHVVLCESAVDVLSYATLYGLPEGTAVASASGAKHHIPRSWDRTEIAVTIAYDRDTPGREAADAMRKELLGKGRNVQVQHPPDGLKDWNDLLSTPTEDLPSSKQRPSGASSDAPKDGPSGPSKEYEEEQQHAVSDAPEWGPSGPH